MQTQLFITLFRKYARKLLIFQLLTINNLYYMRKVLIIDDDKIISSALSAIIRYEGYESEWAEDGKKGLEILKNTDYGVVLCDIEMPELNGFQVLEKTKELGICTPIV